MPSRIAVPHCEKILEEIEALRDELADVSEEIAQFSLAARDRVAELPSAFGATVRLSAELALLAANFSGVGGVVRAIRVGKRFNKDEMRSVGDIAQIALGIDDVIDAARDFRDVINLSDLRRLTTNAERLWDQLKAAADRWEVSLCSLHLSDT